MVEVQKLQEDIFLYGYISTAAVYPINKCNVFYVFHGLAVTRPRV